jgi:MFS family permease
MQEFKQLFKNYKFVALLVSQVLSQLTVNILSFLILIKLFEQTGSSIATSFVWVAYAVPAIIIGPVAAALVDFVDKRLVLMVTNLLQALIVFVYAILLYKKLVFLPYTIVLTYSFLNQFYVPAEAASLPMFVNEKHLPQANSIFFITQQSSLVIGFGLAGIFDAILGFRPTVILMSFLLFVGFLSASFLPRRKPENKLSKNFEAKISDFFGEIVEGYRFIRGTKKILLPFTLLLGLQVVIAVIVTNLPRIATDILMITPTQSGLFIMLPAGVGAVIGTLVVSKLLSNKFKKGNLIFLSMALFAFDIGFSTIFLPFVTFGFLRSVIGALMFLIVGFTVVGVLVPSMTYLQEETPEKLLGRVFGNFWFLTTVVTVLPVLFSATITDLLGIRWLLIILSFITILIMAIFRERTQKL